jgi:hypothetical protein
MNALGRIRRFAEKREAKELCALCAVALGERHAHVVEVAGGKLLCACAGCATVFDHPAGKFRRVGDRVERLSDFRLADDEWRALGVPVGLAFFRTRSAGPSVLAFYPSPLGAVESAVPPEAWEPVVRNNPALRTMEADVEALLVRRGEGRIVPIDRCYALIGLLRREWRGFSGGDAVGPAVDRFFEELA